jgi:hypothetical protein
MYSGTLVFGPEKTHEYLELADHCYKAVEASGGRLVVNLAFGRLPEMPKIHSMALVFYDGPEDQARKLLAPLFGLGPIIERVRMMPYAEVTVPTPASTGPPTHQRFSGSTAPMIPPLDVEIIQTLINDFDAFLTEYGVAVAPSKVIIELRSSKKSSAVPVSGTALASREKAILLALLVQYDSSVPDSLMREETKDMIGKVREQIGRNDRNPEGGPILNANFASGSEKLKEIFGENLPRLRELKKKYDPNFIFNKWYPIAPIE